jgi:hypothetical protein
MLSLPLTTSITVRESGSQPRLAGIKYRLEIIQMLYRKINVELIVAADEAQEVVAALNSSLDRLEEKHTLFGGEIETVAFEHRETRKRSALAHTHNRGRRVGRSCSQDCSRECRGCTPRSRLKNVHRARKPDLGISMRTR